MITHFFSRSKVLSRIQCGPLGPYLDGFARHLSDKGYSRYSGGLRIRLVADFSRWLERRRTDVKALAEQEVTDFLSCRRKRLRANLADEPTLAILLQYLRRVGTIPEPPPARSTPLDLIVQDYAEFLSVERGLMQVTVENYLGEIRRFLLDRFGKKTIALDKLRPKDVSEFLIRDTTSSSLPRVQLMTCALRSFLSYLYQAGKLAANLASSVPSVANRRSSDLDQALEPKQVEQLLLSCDQAAILGRRDYAVLLLLARLGLRGGEVVNLTLDDIDWEAGELLIRGKGARQDRLPMRQDVGQALATYLKKGRPSCACRQVFLRNRAPRQGFHDSTAIRSIVDRALTRAGLHPKHRGSHLLRHSLGTNMLRNGSSLTQIGQILRHERTKTTEIYAKVDRSSLQALTLPWPGGNR